MALMLNVVWSSTNPCSPEWLQRLLQSIDLVRKTLSDFLTHFYEILWIQPMLNVCKLLSCLCLKEVCCSNFNNVNLACLDSCLFLESDFSWQSRKIQMWKMVLADECYFGQNPLQILHFRNVYQCTKINVFALKQTSFIKWKLYLTN